jgi:hypothetical protein
MESGREDPPMASLTVWPSTRDFLCSSCHSEPVSTRGLTCSECIQPDFRCPFCGSRVESQDAPCGEECESKAAAEFYADQAYEQQCEDADRLASIEEVNGGGK